MQKITPCLWFDNNAEEAVSFYTSIFRDSRIGRISRYGEAGCDSQEEVDYYWEKLSEGGNTSAQQCGWLKDRFGVSWQIVPNELAEMFHGNDTAKSEKVMNALLQMKKIDIKKLKQALE